MREDFQRCADLRQRLTSPPARSSEWQASASACADRGPIPPSPLQTWQRSATPLLSRFRRSASTEFGFHSQAKTRETPACTSICSV